MENQNNVADKLKRLEELEKKEAKVREYNRSYYRNWKVDYDKKVDFYNKWFGKEIKGVKLV